MKKRKIIFLDRDGTINADTGYIHKIDDFFFMPNVIESLKLLKNHGYEFIIVTNQSGIARGIYTIDDFWKFNNHLIAQLAKHDIEILKTYFCPYHQTEGVNKYKKDMPCRKPKTGMLEQAQKDFAFDKRDCWMIGDKLIDAQTGYNFEIKSILLTNMPLDDSLPYPDFVANNILEAAHIISNK